MKRFQITVNGVSYVVDVEELAPGAAPAPVFAPTPAPVAAPVSAPAPAPAPEPTELPAGDTQVCAPLPGTILSIAVAVGNTVKTGDLLCTVEAMKMENEIVAPCDGTISAIATRIGANVNAGEPLISIA